MEMIDDKHARLELADRIRMNQLVRQGIDFPGFLGWFETLALPGQIALLRELNDYAGQARFPLPPPYVDAFAALDVPSDDPLLGLATTFPTGVSHKVWMVLDDWLLTLSSEDRLKVFQFFVFLFGIAEQSARCGYACNHWWHRDLLDERVVADLLSNPHYYQTGPDDDARVKSKPPTR